jgi:DNA-binding LacI/PurR family transcriptional regulator
MIIHKPRVTLKILAEELGISQATVCRALRGDKLINAGTRKKVKDMANTLGYHHKLKGAQGQAIETYPLYTKDLQQSEVTIYDIAHLLNLSPATVSRALNNRAQVKKETKLRVQAIGAALKYNLCETAKTLKETKKGTITIQGLAQKLNLSAATVSRCLNEKSGVSDQTSQLVKKVAEQAGFFADSGAVFLKAKKMLTIGIIIPDFSAPIALVLQGIESIAKQLKINVVVINGFAFHPLRKSQLRHILKNADGILTMPGPFDDITDFTKILEYKNVPHLCLGSSSKKNQHEVVSIDPYQSIFELASHLIDTGHRRLCMIDPMVDWTSRFRIEAFRHAIYEGKLDPESQLVISDVNNFISTDVLVDRILSNKYLPDAIIMINCLFDEQAIATLRKSGIAIDKGLVVCEFDLGSINQDRLGDSACLTHDFYHLGVKGISALLGKIDGKSDESKPVFANHKLHFSEFATAF